MPIGKNSIKRVINNGYSKVTTDAPDMENSVVLTEEKPAPKKKSAAGSASTAKKTAETKTATAKTTAKKATAAKTVSEKPEEKAQEKTETAKKSGAGGVKKTSSAAPKRTSTVKKTATEQKATEEIVNNAPVAQEIAEKKTEDKSYVNLGDRMPDYLL